MKTKIMTLFYNFFSSVSESTHVHDSRHVCAFLSLQTSHRMSVPCVLLWMCSRDLHGREELLNKLFFPPHKKCSRSFIKLRLNHWCHMDYFNNVLATFLGLKLASCIAVYLGQGYSNLAREIHFPAEFSSNPNQTHLSMLINVFRIIRKSYPI